MRYFIKIDNEIAKAKVLYYFLKQRKCRLLTAGSLERCVKYDERPSRFYQIYVTNDKEFIYECWKESVESADIISLEDFIKQHGVVTL